MDLSIDEPRQCSQWATIAFGLDRMMEAAQKSPQMPDDVSGFVNVWREISRTGRSPDLVDFVIGLKLRLDQIRPASSETGLGTWLSEKRCSAIISEPASSSSGDMDIRSREKDIRTYTLQEIDSCAVIAIKLDKMMVKAQENLRMPNDIQAFVTIWGDISGADWSPTIYDFLMGLQLRMNQIELEKESDNKGEDLPSPKSGETGWLRQKFGKLKAFLCCCCKTSAA